MLATHGAALPHRWIAGDDELGRPYWFRRRLASLGERDLLAVPSNTTIRDRETPPPEAGGQGRPPHAPGKASWPGAKRLRRRPGGASMSAMVRKGLWWSRRSNGVWSPEPIGGSKATRNC